MGRPKGSKDSNEIFRVNEDTGNLAVVKAGKHKFTLRANFKAKV